MITRVYQHRRKLGFGLAIVAQVVLYSNHVIGAVLMMASILLWGVTDVRWRETRHVTDQPEEMPPDRLGRVVAGLFGLLLLPVIFNLSVNALEFSSALVTAWFLCVSAWLLALWDGMPAFTIDFQRWEGLALAGILATAAFGLYFNLDRQPEGMLADAVENVLDVHRIQVEDARDIYFERNSGREPLYFYITALVGEPTFLSAKFVSASVAFLTILALYSLGRTIEGRTLGLAAAGLGAVCIWQIVLARLGLRVTFGSFAAVLLMLFLWRAVYLGHRFDYLMLGLVLGIGLYGYASFRVAPVLVMGGLGVAWWRWRRVGNVLATIVIAFVTYFPLMLYALRFPEVYWLRVDTLSQTQMSYLEGLARSLLMLNVFPDPLSLHVAEPGAAVVHPITATLFVLGIVVAVRRQWLLLLVAFVIFILPSALAVAQPLEMPSARRAILAFPVVMLIAASALTALLQEFPVRWRGLTACFVLAIIGVMNLSAYHQNYGADNRVQPERELATFIQGAQNDNIAIVYGNGWVDPRAVAIWLDIPQQEQVLSDIACEAVGRQVLLMAQFDETSLTAIEACGLDFDLVEHQLESGYTFWGIYFKDTSP